MRDTSSHDSDIFSKYGKNPFRTVRVTERTRNAGRADGRTDEQMD